ncbi:MULTISPECIES: S8 family serine peptidase [Leeuwenhoekiella]|uniref:Cell wall-associated protein (CWBP23) n=1 Tax=Leeuwenhoekiella blandensis (strain CECT 7118 / CCUG 51940 / KCTC 22103 / MED217) TaxID=398720 RepID=A3XNJ0_LEEBM|nr:MULTISPECIES: S8 family serine peptidase [Leeuwenhoekiella]EAQ48886.1 cell wall-associated protein precursor (CWBP23) [Leeuwenhoekiella blandensis MED217]MAO43214.1 hypothetical protein [Leeuwenhoekiella sp.]MBQ50818.1 hypothetical protein [Leeuwenhoekiella sp.]|tara:strand:- start:73150 stop:74808 length:1659 start_codon:yes stop_codon:yes gene_type:complete
MIFKRFLTSFIITVVSQYAFGQRNYTLEIADSTQFNSIKPKLNDKTDLWYLKDIYDDAVMGISYNKAIRFGQNLKYKENITVAVLDMPVDSDRLSQELSLWINTDEIPDNQKDDDLNGYIDDVNGWNFLGEVSGNQQIFGKYDYTRILDKYLSPLPIYKLQSLDSINSYSDNKDLVRASKRYIEKINYANEEVAYAEMIERILYDSRIILKDYLSKNYSLNELDSLKPIFKEDTLMSNSILRLYNFKKYGFTESYIRDYYFKAKGRLNFLLNPQYEDRILLADDRLNTTTAKPTFTQGNAKLNNAIHYLDHGALMTNFISDRKINNDITLKIMPLVVSSLGDEYDKDIYNAIKYAVDNGARVINMSFSKNFSTNPEIIKTIIEYANDHNVLIVTSAGNDGVDIDIEENKIYPNDESYPVNNFIVVGSTAVQINNNLVSKFSNYGKMNVDLFAPGERILITNSNRDYEIQSGTSVSTALVSKTIGLILSYFPDLTAKEVKEILLSSVTKIKGEVSLGLKQNKKNQNFERVSQSGGILNAYNALKLAKEVSSSK